jgi:hypothetical protein
MFSGTNCRRCQLYVPHQAVSLGRLMALLIAAAFAFVPPVASAQPGWSNYGLYESQRRDAIARQLGIQEDLRAQSGLPSRVFPGLQPYSLESIYAGLATPLGARSWGGPHVFEPWPLVPGDIYGRQFDFGTQTPLGHVTTYTGPNSYVYEPYYAAPQATPAPVRPLRSAIPLELPRMPPPPLAVPSPGPSLSGSSVPEELPPPAAETLREF